ncbi:hypothetical protein GCK72_004224 [Caenorhabditis remanei]|uniref:WAP domain-containing protein n=1 Tax=Caenorhabditis remanei TaxID=31234 RepID=E3MPZ9_CAERE|nr:hypothetical protein GCK72_004224 [Caenorhabditis remanei]EFP06698.1 hypothetical protein CRE_12120 [Caenorhabditis remanei]KAF1764277.1 hypothetical protein GCK72_004224 [Caenorhabditis remanei]
MKFFILIPLVFLLINVVDAQKCDLKNECPPSLHCYYGKCIFLFGNPTSGLTSDHHAAPEDSMTPVLATDDFSTTCFPRCPSRTHICYKGKCVLLEKKFNSKRRWSMCTSEYDCPLFNCCLAGYCVSLGKLNK